MKSLPAGWTLAYRNILRNRRRSVATAIAVTCGFLALVLLGGYIVRAAHSLSAVTVYLNMKGHVAIRKSGSLQGFMNRPKRFILHPEDIVKVRDALKEWDSSIESTGEFLTGSGLMTDGQHSGPVVLTGVDPELYARLARHPEVMKWAADWARTDRTIEKMASQPRLISITEKLAESMGRKTPFTDLPAAERDVQILVKTYERDLGAVDAELGPSHSTGMAFVDMTSAVAPLKLVRELLVTEGAEYLAVFLRDGAMTSTVARKLRTKLGDDFEILTTTDENWSQFYVGQMNFLYVMGAFFTILILGTVSLAIVNTTTLNLLERTRELGTLRAIGYPPKEVRRLFSREAIMLCSACIILGVALSIIIAELINSLGIRFNPPGAQGSVRFFLVVHPGICTMMAILLVLVTLASTNVVTRRKSRSRIVALLGETGA